MNKQFRLYILVSLIAGSVYLPGITNSLLADDWPVIMRTMNLSSQNLFTHFCSTSAGWYRPMFDVLISFCFRVFGYNAVGYHLVAFLLYVCITGLVGYLVETLVNKRGIGLATSFLFGIHSVHSEPVLWVSSMNELLAGLFVLLSLKSYLAFRKSDKPALNYCLTGLFYSFSLASKETSFFLPIMFIGYDVLLWSGMRTESKFSSINWRSQLANLPFIIIMLIYLSFRLQAGSPYSTDVPVQRIFINGLYYFFVQVLMLPENYGYLSSVTLWRQNPLLPIFSVCASVAVIGVLIRLYIKLAEQEITFNCHKVIKFTAAWSLVALSPVILTATGRTAFMSSIGVVWTIALCLSVIWDKAQVNPTNRKIFIASVIVFVFINLLVSSYRGYWWRQAGVVTQNVIRELDSELQTIPRSSKICLVGLPDHLHHAYTFRNAFPYLGQMLYPDYQFEVILDTELNRPSENLRDCVVYYYKQGVLERNFATD